MRNSIDFSNKVVFVAGGTSGINLGVAEGFARAGARLAVLSRSQDKVDAAVEKLSAYGESAMGVAADVRDYEAVEDAFRKARTEAGPVDVLVSGAAGNFPARALDMSSNGFRAVVDIDLVGTYHVMRAGYDVLRKPGACVINISAPQAFVPAPLQSHVCAAKAGVDMLTRVLALEWGGAGVQVNSIVPGPIRDTEGMARLAPTESMQQAVANSVPLKRMGEKEDVASFALALASPLGAYVSGAVIPVDGGWSLTGFGEMMSQLADMIQQSKTG
ncbi:MAG: putative 2,4-dienoyl-CoA reductase [Gammaproteobacteria bacterium]|nr:putative 2,4-dienoyl-CoA reductase [Gammaproteobacteria bacterium]